MPPLLLAVALAAQVPAPKPVLAVFPIEDRRGQLKPEEIQQLTDYFGVQIAKSGGFLVVPRSDIEAALARQKVASYQACYDESCQIEIGKALAAEKVLHTQIVQVGNSCAVTSTLYDLRISATERAASKKSTCDSDALVAALEAVAAEITGKPAQAAQVAPPPPPKPPEPETYSLRLDSSPRRAAVLVEGTNQGRTPAVIRLPRNKPQKVTLEREGYEPFSEIINLDRDQKRVVELRMTPERKRSRNEWFGLSVGLGTTLTGAIDLSIWLRFVNLHFGSFVLTALEVAGGPIFTHTIQYSDDCISGIGYCRESAVLPKLYVGPRVGYKITFGEDHNLEVSTGGGLFTTFDVDSYAEAAVAYAPAVTPRVMYQHLGAGKFSWGIGVKAILPIQTKDCLDELGQGGGTFAAEHVVYARCENQKPFFFLVEVPIGWYF